MTVLRTADAFESLQLAQSNPGLRIALSGALPRSALVARLREIHAVAPCSPSLHRSTGSERIEFANGSRLVVMTSPVRGPDAWRGLVFDVLVWEGDRPLTSRELAWIEPAFMTSRYYIWGDAASILDPSPADRIRDVSTELDGLIDDLAAQRHESDDKMRGESLAIAQDHVAQAWAHVQSARVVLGEV